MTVNIILLLSVIFMGIALVLDRRRSKDTGQVSVEPNSEIIRNDIASTQLPSADEMGPTLTGRFRVQQMLDKINNNQKKSQAVNSSETTVDEESESLPDPFAINDDSVKPVI